MKRVANTVKPSRDEKRIRFSDAIGRNWFDALSDDLVISILSKISASAKSPSDLIGVMSSCKRMKILGMDLVVLKNASCYAISIPARSWCDQAHQFLCHCIDAGNMEASYILGMIEFYCLGHYARGVDLLARAAQASHPEALYSLAIILFIGSGDISGPDYHHNLDDPAALCAKSSMLGHRDAITEIGHCLWRCANMPHPPDWFHSLLIDEDEIEENGMELEEDVGNTKLSMYHEKQAHPANLFLVEWWRLSDVKSKRESDGLELCSRLCGRRETRSNEFYRCRCNKEFYCSHACQDVHWETEHHATCHLNNE
ncbi:F-box protein [Carex littledalei]|uniref:F-box protein n=1 Tax=Carex littledalei TaxID=544730 RepID=A0A833QZE5_9POAL|nr:F-box protein [Carex littledalei]